MATVTPTPVGAEIFLDPRGEGRTLRARWHHEDDVVVLSLWRGSECTGTFRLTLDEVPALIELLRSGVDTGLDATPATTR